MPYVMTTKLAGDEISSTYEGRHVEIQESDLVHPSHADGFVDKGDPIVMGDLVGVAFKDAAAATDVITVDTEGVWALSVVAANDNGNVAVARGDTLYINNTTAIISKIATVATQRVFGYALSTLVSGTTGIVAVKVHWDPVDNRILDDEPFLFGNDNDLSMQYDDETDSLVITGLLLHATTGRVLKLIGTVAAPALADGYGVFETDITVSGILAGYAVASSTWLNFADASVPGANICAVRNDGIYLPAGITASSATMIIGGRFHYIADDGANPGSLYLFSTNIFSNVLTAILHVNAIVDLGGSTGAVTTNAYKIPLFRDVSAGKTWYVNVYDG